MKADHRKQLEQNELASRLARWWKGSGEARKSSMTWAILGVIVLVAVLVFFWRYWNESNAKTRATVWKQIEEASKPDDLQSIIDANRGSAVGRAAKAQLARMLMTEGVNKLGSRFDRSKAIGDINRARDLYTELAKEAKDDALLQREALLASAKAEESLVGIPKADNSSETFGNLDRALELYDETAQKFDKTPQGKEAAERAKDIRENKSKILEFYENLNKHLAQAAPKKEVPSFPSDLDPNNPFAAPELPKTGPITPAGPPPPLLPPFPDEPKPKEKASDAKPALPPPPKPKDTKPSDPKPADTKPVPPLTPPKDPAQPAPKSEPKPEKPDKPEKK